MDKVTGSTRGSHRGRRLGLSALLAGLVVALCVGVFASIAGADDESSGDVSAQAITAAANNPLAAECGLNIVLVVDRSGSTSNFNGDYKAAAKAFINGLVGTPSNIGLVTFSDTATVQSGYKSVSANDDGLDADVDGLPDPGGFTNWQDALEKTTAGFTGPVPDLVIFITDGNPTVHNGSGDNLGNAITAANTLKSNGHTHITGIAVGGGVNTANIADITGAGAGVGGADPDVHQSDTDSIAADLNALAVDLCGGTVTLHKEVRTGPNTVDSTTPSLVNGWDFAAGNGGPSGTTGDDGTGAVTLDFDADHLGSNTITESAGSPGYVIESVDCGTGPVSHTASGFSLTVSQQAITSCTVVNTPNALGSISVNKVTTHGVGGPFTVHVTGPFTDTTLDGSTAAENTSTPLGAVGGLFPGFYTVNETGMPEGWSFTGVDCGEGATVVDQSATFLVLPGSNISCTYTNDEAGSNLTIVKTAEEGTDTGTDLPIDYTLTVANEGPADAHVDASVVDMLPAGESLVSVDPPAGVTCDTTALPKITCSVPASMLKVGDPAVEIGVSVTVPNGSGSVTNKSLVTSSDDPAPCEVTSDDITCSTVTDNFSEVVNQVPEVAGIAVTTPVAGPQVEAAQAAALAFTGSNGTAPLLGMAGVLVIAGAALLLVSRRRKGLIE
jgi:von Willebrand factor type A domain/Domain of unknown function DUF11